VLVSFHKEETMIDPYAESMLPIADAPKQFPGDPALGTVWRWSKHGVGGKKLDVLHIGGRVWTSKEAIRRFIEAGTSETVTA
jgi:hypothetical protein